MAHCVLDASVTIAALAPDELDQACGEILARTFEEPAAVPALWFFEVANIVALKYRRGLLLAAEKFAIAASIRALQIECDTSELAMRCEAASDLALRYKLSVYDASYLELAVRLNKPLATIDNALLNAAADIGFPTIP
jgi:predicted nucleic acid-binding protein